MNDAPVDEPPDDAIEATSPPATVGSSGATDEVRDAPTPDPVVDGPDLDAIEADFDRVDDTLRQLAEGDDVAAAGAGATDG